jgi:4-hydroxy-tetrahydrodipicolinate reductase
VARAVLDSSEFELVSAVARKSAGADVAVATGAAEPTGIGIVGDVHEALARGVDVLIDYTHPDAVKANVIAALEAGAGAVIGTSGLTAADLAVIDDLAREKDLGAIAAGNFSLTAALLKHFAGMAARHVPHWEIVDLAHAGKPDAPSGTARELAEYLGEVAVNRTSMPVADTIGEREARGATLGGAQVHSLRLPSYVLSVEAIFGLPSERLTIRHDAGSDAAPYVAGTLLAAREVVARRGLVRGLDTLLFGGTGTGEGGG